MAQWINKPPLGVPLISGHPHLQHSVGWWPFLGGAGGTAKDYSGLGQNGDLTDMAFPPTANSGWIPGLFGKCLGFDSIDDMVIIATPSIAMNVIDEFSICMWIYPITIDHTHTLLEKLPPSGNQGFMFWTSDAGAPSVIDGLALSSFGVDNSYSDPNVLTAGIWQHVAVSKTGTAVTFYVNGINAGTDTLDPPISHPTAPAVIGGGTRWGDEFNGYIDDVRIDDIGLTQIEIQDRMEDRWAAFRKPSLTSIFVPAAVGVVPQIKFLEMHTL